MCCPKEAIDCATVLREIMHYVNKALHISLGEDCGVGIGSQTVQECFKALIWAVKQTNN